jgi:hypothetical protein
MKLREKIMLLYLLVFFAAFIFTGCAKYKDDSTGDSESKPGLYGGEVNSPVPNTKVVIDDSTIVSALDDLQSEIKFGSSACSFKLLDDSGSALLLDESGSVEIDSIESSNNTIVSAGDEVLNKVGISKIEMTYNFSSKREITIETTKYDEIDVEINLIANQSSVEGEYENSTPLKLTLKAEKDGEFVFCPNPPTAAEQCGDGVLQEHEACDNSDFFSNLSLVSKNHRNWSMCFSDCQTFGVRAYVYKLSYNEENQYFRFSGSKAVDVECKRGTVIKQIAGYYEGKKLSACETGVPYFISPGELGDSTATLFCGYAGSDNDSAYGVICGKPEN